MLNRLGHSETYRFTLGLETAVAKVLRGSSSLLSTQTVVNPAAIAKALQESSNLLSTQIVVNPAAPSAFHAEFGNFDQFLNTLDEHTAHSIIMTLLNR